MGIKFPLNYTNIVAFFTLGWESLECSLRELRGFFYMLEDEEWRLITRKDDSDWRAQIREVAEKAGKVVDEYGGEQSAVFSSHIMKASEFATSKREAMRLEEPLVSIRKVFAERREVLEKLTFLLRETHDLFLLGIGSGSQANTVAEFLEESVRKLDLPVSSLSLIPDPQYEEPLDFIDPFPGASQICRFPERWPGVLIWNRFGNTFFLPLDRTREALHDSALVKKMTTALSNKEVTRIESEYVPPPPENHARILHLSDLHFGTDYAAQNYGYLLAFIKDELEGQYERIVITGDLFDSPWKRKWRAFENFQTSLRLVTRSNPIVIPGNHDNRILGNAIFHLGSSYKYLAELGGELIKKDPDLKCLFFCFNSNKAGNFARGEVLQQDLTRMATEYHVLATQTPDIKNWLKVALVHHHPFKFDAKAEGATARFLKAFNIPESKLVDMDQSKRFLCWCADRGVQLILHGHRHVQRKISQAIPVSESEAMIVTAIGCGTSLGAEGIPSSFNLVTWNPATQRWATLFYRDENSGGFRPVRATSTTLDPLNRSF